MIDYGIFVYVRWENTLRRKNNRITYLSTGIPSYGSIIPSTESAQTGSTAQASSSQPTSNRAQSASSGRAAPYTPPVNLSTSPISTSTGTTIAIALDHPNAKINPGSKIAVINISVEDKEMVAKAIEEIEK